MPRHPLTDAELAHMRTRILAETAKIIASEGYPALSMRRLASALHLTAGALYRYFPTKSHVLFAYWAEAIEDLRATLSAIDTRSGDHIAILAGMLSAYAEFALRDPIRFRLLFLENDLGHFDEFAREHPVLGSYELVRDQVAEAIAGGGLRPLPADTVTQILWGAVHGILTLALTVKQMPFEDGRHLGRLAAETALRGLATTAEETAFRGLPLPTQ